MKDGGQVTIRRCFSVLSNFVSFFFLMLLDCREEQDGYASSPFLPTELYEPQQLLLWRRNQSDLTYSLSL